MRSVKILFTTAVRVYLPPPEYGPDAAAVTPEALVANIQRAVDKHSDGRNDFDVETIHTAAERLVRGSIESVVDAHVRLENKFDGGTMPETWQELEDRVNAASRKIVMGATQADDACEHALVITIAKDRS